MVQEKLEWFFNSDSRKFIFALVMALLALVAFVIHLIRADMKLKKKMRY